jgi:hypothetical protein
MLITNEEAVDKPVEHCVIIRWRIISIFKASQLEYGPDFIKAFRLFFQNVNGMGEVYAVIHLVISALFRKNAFLFEEVFFAISYKRLWPVM